MAPTPLEHCRLRQAQLCPVEWSHATRPSCVSRQQAFKRNPTFTLGADINRKHDGPVPGGEIVESHKGICRVESGPTNFVGENHGLRHRKGRRVTVAMKAQSYRRWKVKLLCIGKHTQMTLAMQFQCDLGPIIGAL